MSLTIEVEHESDGRWLAEATELPGVATYGQSAAEAVERVQVLALRVIADRWEHGERPPFAGQLFRVMPERTDDPSADNEACRRFERHFGAIDSGRSNGADNESIDADLAREYADTHEPETV